MKIAVVTVVLATSLLCGCGEKKYEYETFRWPAGTEDASYCFYKQNSAVGKWEDHTSLTLILQFAQDELGYEYVGSVGDTIILRRPNEKLQNGYTGAVGVIPNLKK